MLGKPLWFNELGLTFQLKHCRGREVGGGQMSGPRGSGCGSTKGRPHFPLLPGAPHLPCPAPLRPFFLAGPPGRGRRNESQGARRSSSEVLGRPLAGLIPPTFRDTHQFVLHRDGGWEGIKFPQRLFPGESGLGKPAPGTRVTWSSFLPNSTLAPKPREPS